MTPLRHPTDPPAPRTADGVTDSDRQVVDRQIVLVNAGTSSPSTSRMLADRVAQRVLDQLRAQGVAATVSAIELGGLAQDIAHAIVSGFPGDDLLAAIRRLAVADAVIAVTPVYKAGLSGLFKSFVDVLDNDLLIAKPVVLAATAGSARHAMVVDEHMRPLFAFLRALPVPTSVFAAPGDWADPALNGRIDRAATELTALITSDVSRTVVGNAWGRYQHSFGGNARPEATGADLADHPDVDFDTDLMRLATGGTLTPTPPTSST